jgi:hypothetical protein
MTTMFFITCYRLSSLTEWRKNVNRIEEIMGARKRAHKKLLDLNSKTYRASIEPATAHARFALEVMDVAFDE